MQTITEYVVRKPVTILGRDYAPGDRIDDPNIKPGVLATLVNTKRIGTQVRIHADTPVPVTSTTVNIPESEVRADIEAQQPGEAPLLTAWRAQFDATPTGQKRGGFRIWLYQQANAHKVRSNGSNEEIVARLDLAGFRPGDA